MAMNPQRVRQVEDILLLILVVLIIAGLVALGSWCAFLLLRWVSHFFSTRTA